MSWKSDESVAGVTRVRLAVRSPSAGRLSIRPKWPPSGLGAVLGGLVAPHTHEIEDLISIQSDPPDLAAPVLALPQISAIFGSDPKPAVELKGHELRFERPGYLPEPQDAADLFDILCDLGDLIEHAPSSSGAG